MEDKEKWKYLFKEVSPLTLAKKRRNGLCKHYGCKRKHRKQGWTCQTCNTRLYRLKNPMRYAFVMVRASARKRHIPFELSFDDFKRFCDQTGYIESKGKEAESLTIDRIDSSRGYALDNIRAMTWADNCKKHLNGLTDPCEPIAQALAMMKGESNWHKFKKIAVEVLHKVEIIQAQNEGGFQAHLEEDICPF